MTSAEEHLQESYRLFSARDFKKAGKAAEKAFKEFSKHGPESRALESLRVMADSALNAREMKTARSLYEDLLKRASVRNMPFYQAAANWGLGESSLFEMDYARATSHFKTGLEQASSISDAWYTAWNAFGLGKSYKGGGDPTSSRRYLQQARSGFASQNQPTYVAWVDHMLGELGTSAAATSSGVETRVYQCPICGSRFNVQQAQDFIVGKLVSCEYCGAAVGQRYT
ncbi:MAG: hypothetical protein QXS20_07005 [Candidatus Thorarchaeota archaeon]